MKTLLPVEATVHPVPWWLAVQVALALASSSEQHRFSSRSRVALGVGVAGHLRGFLLPPGVYSFLRTGPCSGLQDWTSKLACFAT